MRSVFRLAATVLFLPACFLQAKTPDSAASSAGAGGHSDATGGSLGKGGSGGNGGSSAPAGSGGAVGTGGSSATSGGAAGGASGGDSGATSADAASDSTAARGGAVGGSGAGAGGRGGSAGTSASGGAGSGGSGRGGAPGSGGSTAPTPCTFPSDWTVGSATYTTYTLPNPITACGYNGNNDTIKNIPTPANFAAIPGNSSSDFNTSNRCGACIQIGGAIVTIVDECPYDGNNNPPCKANPTGHMDLANAAASAGGVRGDPNVHGQNQWKFVPCPVTGTVVVRLKPANNNEFFIENEILPIASVVCNGQTASRTSYGAWHFNSNITGATCEVSDIAGRKISITVGSTQGQDVDTGVQFPKCL